MPLDRGARLGPYEIVEPLGAGGMGEVYRARDPRLGRDLAIKVLTPSLAQDAEALGRFEREARTASSLNHPNIVHIYEIGEAVTASGPVHYIAMEYIEGQTLRARLKAGERWKTLLEPLTSVAEALAKAHKAGIVHRDLKPENVMITSDGYPKVVDFGLAKLFERGPAPVDEVTAAAPDVRTGTGMLLGTPSYMSPEQAQGKPADHRSDIFSFGCILYEATTGRRTFAADSAVATLHAIVYESPSPVEALSADAPSQLHRIITACLAKDPSQRYQSTADLVSDLRALSRPSATPNTETAPTMAFSESTRPSGSGDSARRWLALGVVVAVAFVGAAVWRARSVVVPSRSPDAGSLQVEKITNRGNVTDIALSNDGRYLAYVTADDARAIWLRDLIEKTENRLVALSRTARLGEFRFAKDGQSIYFDSPTNGPDDAIYRVPLIGGTPRLVRRGALLDALSPDDKHIIERRKREGAWRLFITNIETDLEKDVGAGTWLSGEWSWSPDVSRLLGAREEGDRFALFQFMADGAAEKRIGDFATPPLDAVWRPGGDGALLVLGVDEEHFRLNYVDLTTGLTKPIGSRVWPRRILARWLTDGTGLIVNEETPYLRRALWLVSYPDGAALRIPADNLDYEHVALSGDGTKLAAVQSVARSTILVSSDPDRGVFNKIASGTGVLYRPCWTADGKVIFSSNDTGAYHLYVAEADGTNPTQLTFDRIGNETEPVASPDGRYIVFVSDRSGERGLYRINRDGTNLIRLTPEPKPHHYDRGPQITPDSQWVLYRHWDSGPRLWKISIDGGAPVFIRGSAQAPQESVYGGAASPDGRYLAYFYSAHDPKSPASSRMEIVISSADRFVKRFPFDVSIHVDDNLRLQWSPDGRNLYYNGGSGGAKLWKQALAGGPPVQITHFEEPLNYFDWSPDGKKLLVSRSSTLSDAVLITHFH